MENSKLIIIYSLICILLCLSGTISGQQTNPQGNTRYAVSGTVFDSDGEPLIGAYVKEVDGKSTAVTDVDGKYSINVAVNGQLTFSYMGYVTQTVNVGSNKVLNVRMQEDDQQLEEIVVIGYGQVTKKDATGSVSTLKASDLNKGVTTTPQDMLVGKVPGLLIVPGSGQPGSGTTIRIRDGSSLSASNSPLIVIDGVTTSDDAGVGMSNVLGAINPEDIESFSVLKDASATAIYGSRASNGVIIITTKKGGAKKLKINYNSTYSASVNSGKVPVLSPGQFRDYMDEYYPISTPAGTAAHRAINYAYADGTIGYYNTDWQDQIFRTGLSTDQNVSVSGGGEKSPFRLSVGYTDQNGTLKGSNFQRFTQAVNFTPKFFNKHLSVNVNLKAMENKNKYVSDGVINSAAAFDPTKPIYTYNPDGSINKDRYDGFFQWINPDGSINRNGSENPVSRLSGSWDHTDVFRTLGNLQLDYSFHFLPELRANMNIGYDYTHNEGNKGNYLGSYSSYTDAILPPGQGRYTDTKAKRENYLFDFYLNYVKDIQPIKSKIDIMGGYSWQHFKRNDESWTYSNQMPGYESVFISENTSPKEYYLISLFSRLNYTFMDKYLLTFTLRNDGTSRFHKDNRWGLFPSVALAWRINDEEFFKQFDRLSNLKFRASYGVTGQQNISSDYYPYIATYDLSTITSTSQYQIGDNFYQLLKPEKYNENIKWESTRTWNVGLDWGFYNNRLSGSVDAFYKETYDLLNNIAIPAGSNFINEMVANIGNMDFKGLEFNVNAVPVSTKDFSWEISANATWVKSDITKLTAIHNPDYVGVPTGGISMGTGNNIQINSVGHAPNTFYVYEQVYNEHGDPVQNAFVDQDGNGIIDNKDLVRKHKSRPDVFFGFNMLFNYKQWDFGFNTHGSIGNWVFNDYNSARSSADYTFSNGQTVRNVPQYVVETSKFRLPISVSQAKSDLFLENASFLKIDNITLGYSFSKLFKTKLSGRISATAQNPFIITKYSGSDPEISSGIDNNAWPRPRIYVLGLSLNF
ncbi:SusC/RagA family TonB-linked outer membrane protein [Dysgonomonas reticulitermitis]